MEQAPADKPKMIIPPRKRGPKPPGLTRALQTAVAVMHGRDIPKTQIAKELNVSTVFVYKALSANGILQARDESKGIVATRLPKAAENICVSIDKGSVSTSLAVMRGMGVFQPDTLVQVGVWNAPNDWQGQYNQPVTGEPASVVSEAQGTEEPVNNQPATTDITDSKPDTPDASDKVQ